MRRKRFAKNVRETSIGDVARIENRITNDTYNANDRNDTNDLEGSCEGEKCNSYRCYKVLRSVSRLMVCNRV